jgi:hypothetical protein
MGEVWLAGQSAPVNQSAVSCVVVLAGIDHEQAWQNEPLSHAVRAHHGKQNFSPTMSAWIQVVPHR